MLGSAADAEDMVQEASVRWIRRGSTPVRSTSAYLVTVVTRLCLDELESARARRVTYSGPWLPEPVAVDESSAVEQADSLSLAFLVLLEELTPPERAAYLLHDVFGYSFDEVAQSLGRSTAACRQLAVRARQHVEVRRQRFDADLEHGRELTDRFLVACATGDLSGLLAMLSDDVIVWTDGGGRSGRRCDRWSEPDAELALPPERGQEGPGGAAPCHSQRPAGDAVPPRGIGGHRTGARHRGRADRGRPCRHQPRQAATAHRPPPAEAGPRRSPRGSSRVALGIEETSAHLAG